MLSQMVLVFTSDFILMAVISMCIKKMSVYYLIFTLKIEKNILAYCAFKKGKSANKTYTKKRKNICNLPDWLCQ